MTMAQWDRSGEPRGSVKDGSSQSPGEGRIKIAMSMSLLQEPYTRMPGAIRLGRDGFRIPPPTSMDWPSCPAVRIEFSLLFLSKFGIMTTVVTACVCVPTIALWMPSTDGCVETGYISWLMLHFLTQQTMCVLLFLPRTSSLRLSPGSPSSSCLLATR